MLRQASVPTEQMWQGDLSAVPGSAAVDPASGLPFPGNSIPQTRINPVATRLSAVYPRPTLNAGTTFNDYRVLMLDTANVDNYNVRLDHVLNQRQRIFVRWSGTPIDALQDRASLLPVSRTRVDSNAGWPRTASPSGQALRTSFAPA